MPARVIAAAAVMLLLALPAQADWVSVGPEGGPIYCGAVTAGAAPEIYVATTNTSFPLLRSTNRGANWELYGASLPNYPRQLVAHSTNPDVIYGIVTSTFYRTTNRGMSWSTQSLGSNTNGNDIAVNPLNPDVVYVPCYRYDGAAWRVTSARSTDGGQSWTLTQVDTFPSTAVYSAAVDPVDTAIIYIGGYVDNRTAFYRSTDCGQTWERFEFPANYYYVYSIYVSPADHNIVFAGTTYGICRSTDRGQTWTRQSTSNYNYRITSAPDNPNIMYSAAYDNVYRSTDGGLNWTAATGLRGTNLRTVLAMPGETAAVYCGSTAGMFKSTDYGLTWAPINSGIVVGQIPALATNPHEPATVWAEFTDYDLFKTTDNGLTWSPQSTPLSCGNICSIAFDQSDPQRIWMLEGSG